MFHVHERTTAVSGDRGCRTSRLPGSWNNFVRQGSPFVKREKKNITRTTRFDGGSDGCAGADDIEFAYPMVAKSIQWWPKSVLGTIPGMVCSVPLFSLQKT